MKTLFRVIVKTDPVTETKADGTTSQMATIVLQEVGGRYEDTYAVTMFDNAATLNFYPQEIVWASLRMCSRERQGKYYQDVILKDIIKFNS